MNKIDSINTQYKESTFKISHPKNAGPIQLALGRLDAPKQAALLHDLEQLWIDNNLATNGENHTLISNEYLQVLAMRR